MSDLFEQSEELVVDNASDLLIKQEHQMKLIQDKKQELLNSDEVRNLANTIDMNDQLTILDFGKAPAEAISSFTGKMLHSVKQSKMEETSSMMENLNKIMRRFDANDFSKESNGVFGKLFNNAKKAFDKLMSKYQTMDKEIDSVYVEIKKYEAELKKSTKDLEVLYGENYKFYLELSKYEAATELMGNRLKDSVGEIEQRAVAGDEQANFELETINNNIILLEQRNYDLMMAKMVSYQSAPQIRMLQSSNNMLIAKINSAFVTTIPIFKLGLIQAIQAKRQKLAADSMSALDETTNELWKRTATNAAENSRRAANLMGQSSVSIETMQETWNTIMQGMEDTKSIQQENYKKREQGRLELEKLQAQYEVYKNKK